MAQSILGGINQEATQQELLSSAVLLLAAIAEKLPRVTGNDQAAVSVEGTVTVALAANQTLSNINALGNINATGGKFVTGDNLNMAGTQHIYNNIIVS